MPLAVRVAIRAALGLLALAYPVVVYVGLTSWRPRVLALVLVVAFGGLALVRTRGARRGTVGSLVVPLVPVLVLSLVTAWFDDARVLLWTPMLVNAALLVVFTATLRPGAVPMVERFARLREPVLPPAGVRHCRRVTLAWCGFFVVNGAIAGWLAFAGPLGLWAAYNGGIAYGLMGLMFVGEYVIRRRLRRAPA